MALSIDSTPTVTVNTNSTTGQSTTTASFTPPANSLVLVLWAGNSITGVDPARPSFTVSTGLPVTLVNWKHTTVGTACEAQAAVWAIPVRTSAAMTITVITGAGSGAFEHAIQPVVLTDDSGRIPKVVANNIGAVKSGTAVSLAYTATEASSWGFLAGSDWTDASHTWTSGSGCTTVSSGSAGVGIAYFFARRTTADGSVGSSTTLQGSLSAATNDTSLVAVEVIPPDDRGQSYRTRRRGRWGTPGRVSTRTSIPGTVSSRSGNQRIIARAQPSYPLWGAFRPRLSRSVEAGAPGPPPFVQAVEVDVARPIARRKAKAVGRAVEADTARPLAEAKRRTVVRAVEADTARPIAKRKVKAVGRAVETDVARTVAKAKRRTVVRATETDVARPIAAPSRKVTRATETDVARPIAKRKAKAVGRAVETDTARTIAKSKRRTVVRATETDVARPIAKRKAKAVGRAVETDTARTIAKRKQRTLVRATETDTARPTTKQKRRTVVRATETDLARPVQLPRAVRRASETDVARPVRRIRIVSVARAVEADTARTLARRKTRLLGRPVETDTGRPFGKRRVYAVARAVETDTAGWIRRQPKGLVARAVETDVARRIGVWLIGSRGVDGIGARNGLPERSERTPSTTVATRTPRAAAVGSSPRVTVRPRASRATKGDRP